MRKLIQGDTVWEGHKQRDYSTEAKTDKVPSKNDWVF